MVTGPELLMTDYDHLNSDHLPWRRKAKLLWVKKP
jgi:hypothetical protein